MSSNSFQNLKTWFHQLESRERILVVTAVIITLILILYFLIFSPLNSALNENRKALENDRELVNWLQEQSLRARLLNDSSEGARISGPLTQVVNQTTRGSNIAISRLQPIGENLQVSIEAVSFNDLLVWLDRLEKRGVTILQSDIVDTDDSGIVQVRRLQLGK